MLVTESLAQMFPYLVPIIVLETILLVAALVDLRRRQHVTGGNKWVWVAVILGVQLIGPAIYLLAGRKEGHSERD
jgi:hypothetical protein